MGWKMQRIAQWTGRVVNHAPFVDENIFDVAARAHEEGGQYDDLVTAGKAGGVLVLGERPTEVRWWGGDYDTWHDELLPLIKRRGLSKEFSNALLNRVNDDWADGPPAEWVHEMLWRAVVARIRHLVDVLIDVIGGLKKQ